METTTKKTDFRILSLHRRIEAQRDAILHHALYPKMQSLKESARFHGAPHLRRLGLL